MPSYRVNEDAVEQARRLIDDGAVEVDPGWSDTAGGAEHTGEAGPSGD